MRRLISSGFLITALLTLGTLLGSVSCCCTRPNPKPAELASPDRRLAVDVQVNSEGAPCYSVQLDGQPVLQSSRLGMVRDDADFTKGLKLIATSGINSVKDDYEIVTTKRRQNHYAANQKIFHLQTA